MLQLFSSERKVTKVGPVELPEGQPTLFGRNVQAVEPVPLSLLEEVPDVAGEHKLQRNVLGNCVIALAAVAICGEIVALVMISSVLQRNYQQPDAAGILAGVNLSDVSQEAAYDFVVKAFENGGNLSDQDAYQLYMTHVLGAITALAYILTLTLGTSLGARAIAGFKSTFGVLTYGPLMYNVIFAVASLARLKSLPNSNRKDYLLGMWFTILTASGLQIVAFLIFHNGDREWAGGQPFALTSADASWTRKNAVQHQRAQLNNIRKPYIAATSNGRALFFVPTEGAPQHPPNQTPPANILEFEERDSRGWRCLRGFFIGNLVVTGLALALLGVVTERGYRIHGNTTSAAEELIKGSNLTSLEKQLKSTPLIMTNAETAALFVAEGTAFVAGVIDIISWHDTVSLHGNVLNRFAAVIPAPVKPLATLVFGLLSQRLYIPVGVLAASNIVSSFPMILSDRDTVRYWWVVCTWISLLVAFVLQVIAAVASNYIATINSDAARNQVSSDAVDAVEIFSDDPSHNPNGDAVSKAVVVVQRGTKTYRLNLCGTDVSVEEAVISGRRFRTGNGRYIDFYQLARGTNLSGTSVCVMDKDQPGRLMWGFAAFLVIAFLVECFVLFIVTWNQRKGYQFMSGGNVTEATDIFNQGTVEKASALVDQLSTTPGSLSNDDAYMLYIVHILGAVTMVSYAVGLFGRQQFALDMLQDFSTALGAGTTGAHLSTGVLAVSNLVTLHRLNLTGQDERYWHMIGLWILVFFAFIFQTFATIVYKAEVEDDSEAFVKDMTTVPNGAAAVGVAPGGVAAHGAAAHGVD